MKNFISSKFFVLFFILSIFSLSIAQPPQKMSYQAVVRNANNELVVNQQIGIKISIIRTAPGSVAVYVETHQVMTNSNGLFSLQVGTGTPAPGTDFSTIAWGSDDYYLKSEIDISGGQNYSIVGTEQLISVPYAFYSGGVDYSNVDNRPPSGNHTGDILYWDAADSSWHIVPVGSAGQVLTLNPNGIPQWYSTIFNQSAPPTIVTDTIFDITGRVAKVQATIVDPGTTGIISSGVCWSTTSNPSIGNNHTADGTSTGTYISTINGLTSGTIFYARAYATNSVGTSYGQPISFTTPTHCGTVTDYDENVYQTIYIGAQCWMKENLRTTHYSNGATISKGVASTSGYYPYAGNKYYYIYNEDNNYAQTYGLLYSWAAVMNGAGSSSNNPSGIQGICPSGWHVPSNAEWCELENYIEPGIDVNCNSTGYRGSMAKKMAAPQYWTAYQSNSFAPGYWSYDTTGFNTSGFSGLPGGRYKLYYYYSSHSSNTASFENINNNGYWWSCTMDNDNKIYYRYLDYSNSGVNLTSILNTSRTSYYDYHYAYSVRCIKN